MVISVAGIIARSRLILGPGANFQTFSSMEKFTNYLAVVVVLLAAAGVVALVLSLGFVGFWLCVFAVLVVGCWISDSERLQE